MEKRLPSRNIFNYPWVYQVFLACARILPEVYMRRILRFLAKAWYAIDANTRSQVESNLSRVIGGDPKELATLSRELFTNYGTYLADWAKLVCLDKSQACGFFGKLEGEEIFRRAYAEGKGIIMLAAHFGNWELGGVIFTDSGVPFNIVTAKDDIASIAALRSSVRAMHDIKTITIDEGTFFFVDIVNALKRGEIVAMLVDRYEEKNGIAVDFFGEKTFFPMGPVLIAMATGAPILPGFTVLEKDGRYRNFLANPIEIESTGNRQRDLAVNVAKIAAVFEKYIRQYPSQWYNFSSIWGKKNGA